MKNLFTETITLYNHSRENRVDVWRRTIIKGVQWGTSATNTTDANGKSTFERETRITIPINAEADGKSYRSPIEYKMSENKDAEWTLNPASGNDVIVYGECNSDITADFTVDDLAKSQIMVTIMSVSDNTQRAHGKTWKVSAL